VELGALVAEALLASAESAEVLSSLGNYIIVEVEVDAADLSCGRLLTTTSLVREWNDLRASPSLAAYSTSK
jgi:hypothetical protein